MTFTHDDIVFDLTVPYADVLGVEWQWSGELNAAGEPLMGSMTPDSTMPRGPLVSLPDLYLWHGPLIPTPRKTTAAMYRNVLTGAAR